MNPFNYGKSINGKYFCKRPKDEKALMERITTSQLIHITGLPKIGKTSLVKEVCTNLTNHYLIYIDFSIIEDFADVERKIIEGLMEGENKVKGYKEVLDKYSKYQPALSLDASTKSVEFKVPLRKMVTSPEIADTLKFIKKINQLEPFIVFDNIQEITKIQGGKELAHILLPKIFKLHYFPVALISTQDIYGESNFDMSEFTQSIENLEISEIPQDDYLNHVNKIFLEQKIKIEESTQKELLDISGPITGDRQQIFYALWELVSNQELTQFNNNQVLGNIFDKYFDFYVDLLSELTPVQKKILKLLSLDPSAKIYSKTFIDKVGPTAGNTIIRTINSLTKRKIIYKHGNLYRYTNPFFREWLKKLYS